MSVLGVNNFTLALEHEPGVLEEYRTAPSEVLSRYRLSDLERESIATLDAGALLEHGVNPIVIRNLLVILGVPHGKMYTHGEAS